MNPIIRITGLSKRYRIGQRAAYHTLGERFVAASRASLRLVNARARQERRRQKAEYRDEVWALRDVTFDIMPGEVIGIIGRNGAGKSTLLKVLSRITEPTSGEVELHGRVGSLLEVGTGFHQELTGRENIFLSGAILGMRKKEIDRRFDEIVAFAEIERFIDTPVKRYSSGMYVRLAFGVAAHLEPEILLVDEVLAVGDAAFQKRCLGKIGEVARQGRTVVFVSHNMASIEGLCGECLYIRGGLLEGKGPPHEMVSLYLATDLNPAGGACSLIDHPGRSGKRTSVMTAVELVADGGASGETIRMGSALMVKVSFDCDSRLLHPVLAVAIKTAHHAPLFEVSNKYITEFLFPQRVSAGTITCRLDHLQLMPGTYYLDLSFGTELVCDMDVVHEAISFEVTPADVFGSGKLPPGVAGPLFWPAKFELQSS
jgi:lipopolysaccharide transport system ATP-binding protein